MAVGNLITQFVSFPAAAAAAAAIGCAHIYRQPDLIISCR
jgi:hypothetical protein